MTESRGREICCRAAFVGALAAAALGAPGASGTTLPGFAAGGSAPAVNAATFVDPAGDNPAGAPDVTTVRVSNDDDGILQFELTFPNRPDFGAADFVGIYLDSDENIATGCNQNVLGVDWSVSIRGQNDPTADNLPFVLRWNGACQTQPLGVETNCCEGEYDAARTTMTMRVRLADIGNPTRLRFVVIASIDPVEAGGLDVAPNRFTWSYQVIVAPPKPDRDTTPPRVKAVPSTGTHGRTAALRYSVFDDRRRAREEIRVLRGARQLAVLRTRLGTRSVTKIYARTWRVPANVTGRLRFCVRAWDAAGNRSAESCAGLVVR